MRGIGAWILPILVVALASSPRAALAQTAPAPGSTPTGVVALAPREELNPAQTVPSPTGRSGGDGDLFTSPEPGPCPLSASRLKFTLRSVEFSGAFGVRRRDMRPAFAADLNQEIGLAELCRIRDRAGDILFRKGLLARVEVPEQRIEGGRLKLEVFEAHVVSVSVRGDAGPAQERIEIYIEKLRGMRPFDIRKAQRYLYLASDVPGVRVAAALRPNAEGSGAVDLVVTVSRKPIDALANVQNYGSRSLGPFGVVARTDFNGFTRFGERNSLVAYSTLGNTEQQVFEALSEARIGGEGFTLRGSAAYGLSTPGGDLARLKLSGRSLVLDAGAYYPLVRARRRNVNLGLGFDVINQKTTFGLGGVLSEDHLRVLFAHVDAEQQWRAGSAFLPAGVFGGNLDFRQGFLGLGASPLDAKTLSRIGGRSDGSVFRGDAHLYLALASKLSGRAIISGQYSPTPLLAYEQYSVGNLTIGRGYDPSALTGDAGIGGAFELRAGPYDRLGSLKLPSGINVTAFSFYDVASVYHREAGVEDRTARSTGGGLSFQLGSRAKLDIAYARPFDRVSSISPHPPSARMLISLTSNIL